MKNKDFWFAVGAILALAGAALQVAEWYFAPYVFSVGAVIVFACRLIFSPKSDDFRIKRLGIIQFISSLLLLGGAYFMFTGSNVWALMLFVAAVLDIYIVWRMPQK